MKDKITTTAMAFGPALAIGIGTAYFLEGRITTGLVASFSFYPGLFLAFLGYSLADKINQDMIKWTLKDLAIVVFQIGAFVVIVSGLITAAGQS